MKRVTHPHLVERHTAKECPIQKIVRILSDAWTILILHDLLITKKRFCELEKSLVGISTRTLTLKLHKLLEEGLLAHDDEHYYSLTKQGKKLHPIIHEIEKVGKKF